MDDRITLVAVVGIVIIGCLCLGGTILAQYLGKEPAPIYGYAVTAIVGYIGGMVSSRGGRAAGAATSAGTAK